MAWAEFTLALVAFFVSHIVPVRPRIRAGLVQALGARGFTIGYSCLSLAALGWVIGAAGRAPHVMIWPWAPWQNGVVLVAMGAVCLILALAIGRPNPFSFGGANTARFDPANPGIVRFTRHPLLVALGLWAFAHMIPNGDLAHVMLFAVFGGFALLGQKIIDRRKQRQMGAEWASLLTQMNSSNRSHAHPAPQTVARLAIAIALYAMLLWLHPWLFGVSPLV